jgi:mRNA interferase MazF
MHKDFDEWNEVKKLVDKISQRVFFHERELWFARIGVNVGYEQDGRGADSMRPIVVMRKFNNEVCWVLPLTRTQKPDNPYYLAFEYVPFPEPNPITYARSVAILSQLRLVDARRLRYKIGTIPESGFSDVKKVLRRLLA